MHTTQRVSNSASIIGFCALAITLSAIGAHARANTTPESRTGLSIKLTALHPRFEMAQRRRVLAELVPRVTELARAAAHAGVPLKQVPMFEDITAPEGDPLLHDAIDTVRREGRASVSMLQRRMRIGYTRAARLVDALEEKGIVGPPTPGTGVRDVLDYGPAAPPKED